LLRFRITGDIPDLSKFVIIGAPHTSNWDFVLGMGMLFALRLRVSWIGKHTLFKPPFGPLMRWMGGIPIDRNAAGDLVEQVAAAFDGEDKLVIGIAPEGTRRRVDRWKTGFYRIAAGAGVPIVIGMIDFGRRELRVDSVFQPTGDMESDLDVIRSRYRGVSGKYPDQFDVT
jgi:1-acyl-sn-glycerol-3-phosphate acyltransferase